MGRSKKYAVDYMKIDVSFFESDNDDMLLLRQKYGYLADVIYLKIVAMIYNHGYYYKFDTVEKLCAKIAKTYGVQFAKLQKIETVIRDLVSANVFDCALYHKNVLTSEQIQRNYYKAVERRLISINQNYWLLDKKASKKECCSQNLNDNINEINVNINAKNVNEKKTTNTSIASLNHLQNNKYIPRAQNEQNNTRNIINDDFDITQEELDKLKKYIVDEIYAKNHAGVKQYMNIDTNKKFFDLILDALIKAARLNHTIELSGCTYSPKYFGDVVYWITFEHLNEIVKILRRKNLDEVNNIDFFILGIVVKYFENLS